MTALPSDAGGAQSVLDAVSLYRFFRAGDTETMALQGVSLSVAAGEMVAVAGPSGSGKSTLLACLAGIDNPDGGSVRINGCRLSHQSERVRARLRTTHIGMLFQASNLLPQLTVAQNVRLAQRLQGRSRRSAKPVLDQLGIGDRGHAYPGELSGGELARAGLAVAVANDPSVILADEPTGELDTASERLVLELLKGRAARGAAILVVSHSPVVAAAADRVIELVDGRVQ